MEKEIETLLQWLKGSDQFYLADNIDVNDNEDSGRGVILTSGELRKNDIVVSIPSHYQLNYNTILWNISLFNNSIKVPGVTVSEDDIQKYGKASLDEDPRYEIYSSIDQEFLLSLTSFQLFEIYVLIEWYFLGLWSDHKITSFWQPFFSVWPSFEELGSVPAIWSCSSSSKHRSLIQLLPLASRKLLLKKNTLISKDWEIIHPWLDKCIKNFEKKGSVCPSKDELYDKFLHIYFIVNSRCLYSKVALRKDDAESQFTMVPFVDFLNHTEEMDVHCYPKVRRAPRSEPGLGQFSLRCGEYNYSKIGEELFLNYGPHSNDFLLNEYGFVLEHNKWNFIDIFNEMASLLSGNTKMISFLKKHRYWGDYTVNLTEISYRVLVALSLIVTEDYKRVEKFLSGFIPEDYFLPKIATPLRELLLSLLSKFQDRVSSLEDMLDECNDFSTQNLRTLYLGYIEIVEYHLDRI